MKPHAHTPALVSDDVTVGVATYLMGNYFGPNAKARIVKLQARKMRKEAYKTTQILNSRWACRYGYDSFVFEYPVFDGHDASDYSHANCVVHPRRGPMIIGWPKIDAIHTLLGRGYDWVVLLAGDAWVERQEMSLGQILSYYNITQEELDRGKSVFIFESKMVNAGNWPPATDKKPAGGLLNSDVILVRNTPEARDFMYVWLHYDKMPERDRDAMYYEQSILWRLTGLDETVMPKNFSFPWHPAAEKALVVIPSDLRELPEGTQKYICTWPLRHMPSSLGEWAWQLSRRTLFNTTGWRAFDAYEYLEQERWEEQDLLWKGGLELSARLANRSCAPVLMPYVPPRNLDLSFYNW